MILQAAEVTGFVMKGRADTLLILKATEFAWLVTKGTVAKLFTVYNKVPKYMTYL